MIEIRFHGRGGQGAVKASDVLAMAAFEEGKQVQAFPFFGVERRGAPVTAFTRISDNEIRIHSYIYEPDVLVVLDPSLIGYPPVRSGLKSGGMAIINESKKPKEIDLGVPLSLTASLDATQISTEIFGVRAIPIVNTIIMGAIAKATDWVTLESLYKPIMHAFPGRVGELNVQACKRGYEEVEVA